MPFVPLIPMGHIGPIEVGTNGIKRTTKEDPNRPYTNHSETESEEEEEIIPVEEDPNLQESAESPGDSVGTTTSGSTGSLRSRRHSVVIVKRKPKGLRRYRGMMFALLSSFIFSVGALVAKSLDDFHPLSLALWKFQGAFLPMVPLISIKLCVGGQKYKILQGIWPLRRLKDAGLPLLVLLRSVLSCNALLLHFYSLKYLSMADALTIASSTPILVTLLARLLLGEKCGVITMVASLLTVFGVVAMTKPPILTGLDHFDTDLLIGSGLALGCMVLSAVSYTVLRYIRRVHHSVTTFMLGLWGTGEMLVLAIVFDALKVPSGPREVGLVAGLAALTFLGQYAIVFAMKSEQAGPVALVRTFDVVFGFFLQIVVLNTIPDLLSIIGATIISFSIVICGFRKWLRGLPEGNCTRARFRYLMM